MYQVALQVDGVPGSLRRGSKVSESVLTVTYMNCHTHCSCGNGYNASFWLGSDGDGGSGSDCGRETQRLLPNKCQWNVTKRSIS